MCKFCSKSYLPKIFLLTTIIISLSLIFGIFKTLREIPKVTPTPAPIIESETVNWKTYNNEEYGFEFKYPKEVNIQEQKNIITVNNNWKIEVYKNDSKKDLKDWFNSTFNKQTNKDCQTIESNIKVKDAYTLLFSSQSMEEKCQDGGYYTISSDKSIVVKWELGQDPVYSDQIIPTFKFIEKNETVDWKTYRNERYGIEFKYPKIYDEKEEYKSCRLQEGVNRGVNPQLFISLASRVWLQISDPKGLTFSEYVDEMIKDVELESKETTSVGGKEAVSLTFRELSSRAYGLMTILEKDGKIYMFSLTKPVSKCFEIENISVFTVYGKMLSTFKFIKSEKPCANKEVFERFGCFISYLQDNPLTGDIVNSDSKLKDYFIENLTVSDSSYLEDLVFTGISRGKFDKNPDKEIVVISFELDVGKFTNSYVAILAENQKDIWQISNQVFEYSSFSNKPQKLIKNDPPLFESYSAATGGTCVPLFGDITIYKLENGKFYSIWTNNYRYDGEIYEGKSRTGKIKSVVTKIDYKDLNNDGNLEIVKEGASKICYGEDGCYSFDCTETISEEKIYEVYKWDSQKQTFVKID